MLDKAKNKKFRAKVTLKKQDARNLRFRDNIFDKALTTYVLRVSPEPKIILKEVSRVVKKNGLFVIVDQFKGENKFILTIFQPFKIALGWGKEYDLQELIAGTPWKIIINKQCGKMSNTRLVLLKNLK